ncbi:MAG: protein phosphatase 2C domain-containing protein [Bacteroidales bacterium]|nr:protein phosphatase 2C domain-containing protein [Bacteroidales bacterium]
MKAISHYCRGESHLASGKPCQDCATAVVVDEGCAMAIVSDGHGGDRYFRSDVGSRRLVDITQKAVTAFAHDGGDLEPYRFFTSEEAKESNDFVPEEVNRRLRWLFSSIIAQWNEAISAHAVSTPLNEWELEHVDQKYREEFLKGDTLEKIYGCTLMCYLQTSSFWLAFQIGDGKLLTLTSSPNSPLTSPTSPEQLTSSPINILTFSQPVPWDDRCFLNKTTSICDSAALEEFRYCFCNDGTFPLAAFLGSDGIDDTYGDGPMLENFYTTIYKLIATKGELATLRQLKSALPLISKRGSKDDMSVALVYDERKLPETLTALTRFQLNRTIADYDAIEERIASLNEKIAQLQPLSDESSRINLQYARRDLSKAIIRKRRLAGLKGSLTAYLNRLTKQ